MHNKMDQAALEARLKKAWKALSPQTKAAVRPLFTKANRRYQKMAKTGAPASEKGISHLMWHAQTALSKTKPLQAHVQTESLLSFWPVVGKEGGIFGFGTYQDLDPGWLEALAVWAESLGEKYTPFPANIQNVIQIPDDATIALAGDWGTGNWGSASHSAPSTKIANQIAAINPDYTIHLGDVYYSGTSGSENDHLVNIWPQGSKGTFALNSNHEMFPGGGPYFTETLGSQ
jgi:hypothetical protein